MDSGGANGLGGELGQQSAWVRRLARRLVSGAAGAENALAKARLAALRRKRAGERVGDGWLARAAVDFARREQRDEATSSAPPAASRCRRPTSSPHDSTRSAF